MRPVCSVRINQTGADGFESSSLIQVWGAETLKDALVNQQRQSCRQPRFQLRADLCLSENWFSL